MSRLSMVANKIFNYRYLAFISLFFIFSCAHIAPQEDVKYWTRFKTRIDDNYITYISISIPPGAEIIKFPNSVIEPDQQKEYSILTVGYPYFTNALHDVHIAFVLYKVKDQQSKNLIELSKQLSSDINIITHNSNLSWFKDVGKLVDIENSIWLHREGFSTGPNTDQKLDWKNEDVYLYFVGNELALGVYVNYYDGVIKNKSFVDLIPKILANINIRQI